MEKTLDQQALELKRLRSQLNQKPRYWKKPKRNCGLRIVSQGKGRKDAHVKDFKAREKQRQQNWNTKLGSKLKDFKGAA